jgi:hypothetical protein
MELMMMARERWTDERLDDLNEKVDDGFKEMRGEFRAVRTEMREGFRAVRAELGAMSRTFIQVAVGGFITMTVGFAATIATVLAHG